MYTLIINFKNGALVTRTDAFNVLLSGDHLIVMTKQTESDSNDNKYYVVTTNDIFKLDDIINYTTKNNTNVYGDK